jgi:hypothetical protein
MFPITGSSDIYLVIWTPVLDLKDTYNIQI